MLKYEYKCVSICGLGEKTTRVLNEYGAQGWELVCVVNIRSNRASSPELMNA